MTGGHRKVPDGAFEVFVDGELVHSKIVDFDGFVDSESKLNTIFKAVRKAQKAQLAKANNPNPRLVGVFRDMY